MVRLLLVADADAGIDVDVDADGSNSSNGGIANALMLLGIVRSDIRSSIAGARGMSAGIPLRIRSSSSIRTASCASLAGYAIYMEHRDRDT